MKPLLIASMLGILLILWLANTKQPHSAIKNKINYNGEIIQVSGIVQSQKFKEDYLIIRLNNITAISYINQNLSNKNITLIGRFQDNVIFADKIEVND